MSGAEYFTDDFEINPYMDSEIGVNTAQASKEHSAIRAAFEASGIEVIKVDAPKDCQDGVYTANWGLCRKNKVILSSLPNMRQPEEAYAEKILRDLGKEVHKPPYRFSGQGDALPCGNRLFVGSNYRTDIRMHQFIAEELGYEVIGLQTIPKIDGNGKVATNKITGWADSFFYDLDLALAVLRPDFIAWCPEAFVPQSQDKIRGLDLHKIEVTLEEAIEGFACNLVSTGENIIMSAHAPKLQKMLQTQGFKTITPDVTELGKGGGYIRCVSLSLDN